MESIDFGRIGVERRRYAVQEIRFSMVRLYRGYVLWASMYGEADACEERERREPVDHFLALFSRCYLPRSMQLAGETRETIKDFAEKNREMGERFAAEVEAKGYEEVRALTSRRVSKKLGPARKQVDLALETELAGPKPSRWRSPFRRDQRLGPSDASRSGVTPRTTKLPGRHPLRPVTGERCSRRRTAIYGRVAYGVSGGRGLTWLLG